MKRRSKSRVSGPVLAVIAAVLGGCGQDFDEDYGVYYSGDSATPPRTAKIKPKIPQPDRALLETPAEPDCGATQVPRHPGRRESATATTGLATPTATEEGTASYAHVDLALRIKLEYERECYRQAEARMRDRLKKLQASTTQTVKAVNGAEQSAR